MSSGATIGLSNGTKGTQLSINQLNHEIKALQNEQHLLSLVSIQCKFLDDQKGRHYNYEIKNNNIFLQDGIRDADFIIDTNGIIRIGKGHSFLAGKTAVLAAGNIKVNKLGHIRRISNLSGHYQPTISETIRYINEMYNKGYVSENTWVSIYSFDKNNSKYVTKIRCIYNGPYKYLKRRNL